MNYGPLEKKLATSFHNKKLLQRALTHCSYGSQHMERLEFLGDAVLGLVIAAHLHDRFPDEAEGHLSRLRAALVRKESLYEVAKTWQLSSYLSVGEGERTPSGGVKSKSIVANAVEAIIGAVFKDAGWDAASELVMTAWQPLLLSVSSSDARDAKSQLQEWTQGKGWGLPIYEVLDLGVTKSPRFRALCRVKDRQYGEGMGDRKKTAELNAAQYALDILKKAH